MQVQVVAASRIEMPVMLRASPMDRGRLHTWLATRKAESDKKREEEEVGVVICKKVTSPFSSFQVASNPWLAKSSQPERKKEEAAGTKQSSSRLASPVCEKMASNVQGSVKEKLRQDLLKAWSGGEKAAVEPRRQPESSVPVGASWREILPRPTWRKSTQWVGCEQRCRLLLRGAGWPDQVLRFRGRRKSLPRWRKVKRPELLPSASLCSLPGAAKSLKLR